MKFKVDENLTSGIVQKLRDAGHEADTVPDQGMTGTADDRLLAVLQSEGRVLLTMDKGIAGVRTYPPDQYAGIVLLRPGATGRGATLAPVRRYLPILLQMDLNGHLFVISDTGIRTR